MLDGEVLVAHLLLSVLGTGERGVELTRDLRTGTAVVLWKPRDRGLQLSAKRRRGDLKSLEYRSRDSTVLGERGEQEVRRRHLRIVGLLCEALRLDKGLLRLLRPTIRVKWHRRRLLHGCSRRSDVRPHPT